MIPLWVEVRPRSRPIFVSLIIWLNVAVFVYQVSLGPAEDYFIFKYGLLAASLTGSAPHPPAATLWPPLTLITSMFIHGSFWHIFGNMIYLWVFGNSVEDRLGHFRFVLFYLACGVFSGLAQTVAMPASLAPIIGASGAIAGVMGAFFIRFPRAHVITLIIIFFFIRLVRVPAAVFLGLWFLFQVFVSAPFFGSAAGNIAYFAHIGGFLVGMVLFMVLEKNK